MKSRITMLGLSLLAGCAGITEEYRGKETVPYAEESTVGLSDVAAFGSNRIQKMLTIHNPLRNTIELHVKCRSIMQPDMDIVLPARRTTFVLVESNRNDMFRAACRATWAEVK